MGSDGGEMLMNGDDSGKENCLYCNYEQHCTTPSSFSFTALIHTL